MPPKNPPFLQKEAFLLLLNYPGAPGDHAIRPDTLKDIKKDKTLKKHLYNRKEAEEYQKEGWVSGKYLERAFQKKNPHRKLKPATILDEKHLGKHVPIEKKELNYIDNQGRTSARSYIYRLKRGNEAHNRVFDYALTMGLFVQYADSKYFKDNFYEKPEKKKSILQKAKLFYRQLRAYMKKNKTRRETEGEIW